MIDDWFSVIELPLTLEQLRQLPRNAAYKYEYFGGRAVLSPRPHGYHAVLDLQEFARPFADIGPDEKITIRALQEADWPRLPKLCAAAFHRVQPFASLPDDTRLKAAEDCLGHTREGGFGPFVDEACLVALRDDRLVGATLVTVTPRHSIEAFVGLPQLTWIFVGPFHARHGVGTALLDAAVQVLRRLGYARLVSSFLVGNEASMLWLWQAGFRLPEQPWSPRGIPRVAKTTLSTGDPLS